VGFLGVDLFVASSTETVLAALVAESLAALVAQLQAMGTEGMATGGAFVEAVVAELLLAASACARTTATQLDLAAMAVMKFVLVDVPAAVAARNVVPVLQLGVGTSAAIGVKHLGNQEEEIQDSALGQGGGNRWAAFAFA